jgi:hypothetical protein
MDSQLDKKIEMLRKQMEVTAKQRGSLLHKDVIAISQLLDEYVLRAQYMKIKLSLYECAL